MQQTPTYEYVIACSLTDPGLAGKSLLEPADASLSAYLPPGPLCTLSFGSGQSLGQVRVTLPTLGSVFGLRLQRLCTHRRLLSLGAILPAASVSTLHAPIAMPGLPPIPGNADYRAFLCEYAVPQLSAASRDPTLAAWSQILVSLAAELLAGTGAWPQGCTNDSEAVAIAVGSLVRQLVEPSGLMALDADGQRNAEINRNHQDKIVNLKETGQFIEQIGTISDPFLEMPAFKDETHREVNATKINQDKVKESSSKSNLDSSSSLLCSSEDEADKKNESKLTEIKAEKDQHKVIEQKNINVDPFASNPFEQPLYLQNREAEVKDQPKENPFNIDPFTSDPFNPFKQSVHLQNRDAETLDQHKEIKENPIHTDHLVSDPFKQSANLDNSRVEAIDQDKKIRENTLHLPRTISDPFQQPSIMQNRDVKTIDQDKEMKQNLIHIDRTISDPFQQPSNIQNPGADLNPQTMDNIQSQIKEDQNNIPIADSLANFDTQIGDQMGNFDDTNPFEEQQDKPKIESDESSSILKSEDASFEAFKSTSNPYKKAEKRKMQNKQFRNEQTETMHRLGLQLLNSLDKTDEELRQLTIELLGLLSRAGSGFPQSVNYQAKSIVANLSLPELAAQGAAAALDQLSQQDYNKVDNFWKELCCRLILHDSAFIEQLERHVGSSKGDDVFVAVLRSLFVQIKDNHINIQNRNEFIDIMYEIGQKHNNIFEAVEGIKLVDIIFTHIDAEVNIEERIEHFLNLIKNFHLIPDNLKITVDNLGKSLQAMHGDYLLIRTIQIYSKQQDPIKRKLDELCFPNVTFKTSIKLFEQLMIEKKADDNNLKTNTKLINFLKGYKAQMSRTLRNLYEEYKTNAIDFLTEFQNENVPCTHFMGSHQSDFIEVLNLLISFNTENSNTENIFWILGQLMEHIEKLDVAKKVIKVGTAICNRFMIPFGNIMISSKLTEILKEPTLRNIRTFLTKSEWANCLTIGNVLESPLIEKLIIRKIEKEILDERKYFESIEICKIETYTIEIIKKLKIDFEGFKEIPNNTLERIQKEIGVNEQLFKQNMFPIFEKNEKHVAQLWKLYLINLFILKKEDLKQFLDKLSVRLMNIKAIRSPDLHSFSALTRQFDRPPTLGFSLSIEEEHAVRELLAVLSAGTDLQEILEFCFKFIEPEKREFLEKMRNNGEVLEFKISFEEVSSVIKLVNMVDKMICKQADSTFDFLMILSSEIILFSQTKDLSQLSFDLNSICKLIQEFYSLYHQSPEANNDKLEKIIENSVFVIELSAENEDFDVKCTIFGQAEGSRMEISSETLEELKLKLVIGGLQTTEANQSQLHQDFMRLMDSLWSIKKSLVAVYQQGDIIDLGRALLAHVDESLRPAFINEAKISLTRVEVHCRASLSAHPAAALRLVDRGLLAVVALLQDSSVKRNNNQARLRLYLTSKQKHLVCSHLLNDTVITQGEFNPLSGIFKYATGCHEGFLKDKINKVVDRCKKQDNIYSNSLFENLSKEFYPSELEHEHHGGKSLEGKVRYSFYTTGMTECLLVHLAKENNSEKMLFNKILMCTAKTSGPDIETFIERAMTDKSQAWYYVLDFHLLKSATLKAAIAHLKFMFSDTRHYSSDRLLCLASAEGLPAGPLHPSAHPDVFEFVETQTLGESKLAGLESRRFDELKAGLKTCVVTAPLSGLGKSTFVARACEQKGLARVTLLLAGEAGSQALEQRLAIVASYLRDNPMTKFALHLKIDSEEGAQGQAERLNQFLLGVCLLGTVPFGGGHLFLDGLEEVYVEVASNCGDLLTSLSVARLCPIHACRAFSFADLDCSLLQAGSRRLLDVFVGYWLALITKIYDKSWIANRRLLNDESDYFDVSLLPPGSHLGNDETLKNYLYQTFAAYLKIQTKSIGNSSSNYSLPISFSQVVILVEIIASQLIELDKVSEIDPNLTEDTGLVNRLRPRFFEIIFEAGFNSVFGSNHEKLREEANSTKETMEELKMKSQTEKNGYFTSLKRALKSVTSWETNIRTKISLFVKNGSLKVLCNDEQKLESDFKTILHIDSGGYFKSPKPITTDDYLQRLIEGVDTEVNLVSKNDNEYQKFRSNPANHLLDFMREQARKFKGKGFVVTRDNYLKLMMLVQRADYSVPVILMGATGCGKTFLVHFAAACLLRDQFCLVALHPGKSEKDLVDEINQAVDKAEACRQVKHSRVWVLFDEFNTSALQPLIAEVMLERRSSFSRLLKPIPPNIVFLAACNPYKIDGNIPNQTAGLVNQVSKNILEHRVNPIPDCLMSLLWDFGQLESHVEVDYIKSMIENYRTLELNVSARDTISRIVTECQKFIREKEGKSSVSLRDVSRFLSILTYCKPRFPDFNTSLAVATAVSYFLRIDDLEKRKTLDSLLLKAVHVSLWQVFEKVSDLFAQAVADNKLIPQDIALNRPLKENLFSLVLTQAIKLPIIICGKPGTSKTLSTTICQAIFKAKQEIKARLPFFSDLPDIHVINFSGSQTTTCKAIEDCFIKAETLAENLKDKNCIVSVFFDEIGLAEIADENPLKVLHQKLEPDVPTVGFVGISNWRLDLSKMNRVIYVSRPDPGLDDLALPFKSRLEQTGDPFLRKAVNCLVETYHDLRQAEETGLPSHPNFHGARDFYNAARQLLEARDKLQHPDSPASFTLAAELAVKRNFGGVHLEETPTATFFWDRLKRRLGGDLGDQKLGPLDPVFHNLADPDSRHLMLFCENAQVEEIVVEEVRAFSCKVLGKPESMVKSFVACRSKAEELEILNSLSVMVYQGYTVVLKRLDAVYGCLYELFNQRYEERRGVKGCYLVYDSHRQWIPVHRDFKAIVLMDDLAGRGTDADLEKRQQPPFLNRFEKQLILQRHLLDNLQADLLAKVQRRYLEEPTKLPNILIHNLSRDMLLALVMNFTKTSFFDEDFDLKDQNERYASFLKQTCLKLAVPNLTSSVKKNESPEQLNTRIENLIDDQITPFYSRNMILEQYLKLGKDNQIFKKFKEEFVKLHPYTSFDDLLKGINTPFSLGSLQVVFTFSEPWILTKILKNRKEVQILQAEEFQKEKRSEKLKIIESLLKDDAKKYIVIQFSTFHEWSLIRELKNDIFEKTDKLSKHILLVIHTKIQDLKSRENYITGVTSINVGIEFAVIDDLENCDYSEFFEILQSRCSEVILKLQNKRPSQIHSMPLWKQIKESILQKVTDVLVKKGSSQNAMKDVSRGVDGLRQDDTPIMLILEIAAKQLSAGRRDPTLDELLQADNRSKAELYTDTEYYVASLIKDAYSNELDAIVRKLDLLDAFSFLIKLSCVKNNTTREAIFKNRWMPLLKGIDSTESGITDITQVSPGIYTSITGNFNIEDAAKLIDEKCSQLTELTNNFKISIQKEDYQNEKKRRFGSRIKNQIIDFIKKGVTEDQKEDLLLFPDFGMSPIVNSEEILLVGAIMADYSSKKSKGLEITLIQTKILMEIGRILLNVQFEKAEVIRLTITEGILMMLLLFEFFYSDLIKIEQLMSTKEDVQPHITELMTDFEEEFAFPERINEAQLQRLDDAVVDLPKLKQYERDMRAKHVREQYKSPQSKECLVAELSLAFAAGFEQYVNSHPNVLKHVRGIVGNLVFDTKLEEIDYRLCYILDLLGELVAQVPAHLQPTELIEDIFPQIMRAFGSLSPSVFKNQQECVAKLVKMALAQPKLAQYLVAFSIEQYVLQKEPLGFIRDEHLRLLEDQFEKVAKDKNYKGKEAHANLVSLLRTSLENVFRLLGYLDSSQPPMKVLTCKPEDFSIHTSIRMKLYLEHSLQHPETMNAVLKTLETEINKKVDDEKVLHVLRFLFKTNNQDKLNDNCLQVLKMDRSLLARNSGENESSITEALFLFGKSEAKEIKDAITELNAKNSKVKNCEKNLEFWLKYLILLSDVNKVDQTIEFINNRDTFLSFTKSQANRYISELLPSSKNPEDSLSYVSLGLVMIALESLKFELGGPNIHREMIDEIDNLRQLRSKIEGTSFELDYLDLLVNILDYIQHQTFAALDAYRAKTRKTRLLHEPVGRWAFVLWLSALAKLAAKKHMMLTELVLAANADTANKVNKTAFDEYKTIHEELTSQLQPPCSKILEFCKADEVDTTYYGKVLGPAHCNFSKFLTTKYDIDFDSIMESLLGQKIEIGPVIEHCFNEYETIILCDSILLTIAEFVTNLKQVVTSLESPNLAQLVESDLQTLLKYNPHPGLQAAHEKLLDHFSQVAPDLERICLEKNKEILANQVAFKKFLADRNPKLGSLIFGSPFGLCILEEISKSMMELRNHLFDSTINALENSEFVYTKTVSVIDMKPTDTMEHLQEQEPDSQSQSRNRRSNPIRKFLITHFQVDLAGTVHFDEAIVAQAFYRQVIGRLGKLVVKPLLRVARDDRNMGTADLDLDGLVRAALAKVTQDKDVVEATSKHQREVVRMFETAKTLPQQDKIAFNLKMMTTMCAKVILDSDDVKPSTKLTVLVPEILGGIASLKEFYDSVPTLHLSFLRKVQLALSFREYKAFLDKGCLGEIYERLQAVIKENKVIKESLTFFAIEVSCQVARLMEAEPEERKKHAESSFDSLPLESETKQRLHSWLERVGGSKEFKLTDAVWIVAAMEKVRDLL
jgi:MoxR-like ATPase/UDP-2,3-diacylglucosamine pyrophosphatase LpxH